MWAKIRYSQEDEIGDVILHACFELLKDYVEVDKAIVFCNLHPEHRKEAPRWWNKFWWRRADLGIMRLQEEAGFTVDGKKSKTAELASTMYDLYIWWTRERPKRPNPYDSLYVTAEKTIAKPEMAKAAEDLLAAYVAEDQAKLLKLMELRPNLWS